MNETSLLGKTLQNNFPMQLMMEMPLYLLGLVWSPALWRGFNQLLFQADG